VFALKSLMAALVRDQSRCALSRGRHLHRKHGGQLSVPTRPSWAVEDATDHVDWHQSAQRIPCLNARIRKRYLKATCCWGVVVSERSDLSLYVSLAPARESLVKSPSIPACKKERPMFIIGQGALNRPDARRGWRWQTGGNVARVVKDGLERLQHSP